MSILFTTVPSISPHARYPFAEKNLSIAFCFAIKNGINFATRYPGLRVPFIIALTLLFLHSCLAVRIGKAYIGTTVKMVAVTLNLFIWIESGCHVPEKLLLSKMYANSAAGAAAAAKRFCTKSFLLYEICYLVSRRPHSHTHSHAFRTNSLSFNLLPLENCGEPFA